jgi:hypothetical protein
MTDMYVYYFTRRDGAAGENVRSTRLATLEAIKGKGEPVMESQTVVDHTELDRDGFLIGFGNSTHAIDDLWSQIRSLKLRAESRDIEALSLNESTEGERKYMLQLESRELRDQAQRLQKQQTDLPAEKFRGYTEARDFVQFVGHPTTE